MITAKDYTEDELVKKIKDIHAIGIRSKTQITKRILGLSPRTSHACPLLCSDSFPAPRRCVCTDAAERLLVVGAFCIGTEQIDSDYATEKGVAVLNVRSFSGRRYSSRAQLCCGFFCCEGAVCEYPKCRGNDSW